MTAVQTTGAARLPVRSRLLLRWLRLPVAVRVLAVYVAARLFSAAVLAEVARFQPASTWTPANPGYGDLLRMWDATWYEQIATGGYPDAVPLGSAGDPQQSPLAFYPVAPLLARVLMGTGLSFGAAGALVSLLTGAAAAVGIEVLLRRALRERVGATAARRGAWSAAVLFCLAPPSLVYQVPYTEGPAVALLVGFLLCLQRRRYLPAALLALLLGLTRPVAVPLSVVVVVHLGLRAWAGHRDGTVLGGREALRGLGLLAASGTAGLLWPFTAWQLTGRPDAYTATMGAWRSGGEVVPLAPWWGVSQYVLGPVGPVVLVLALAAYVAWLCSARARALGPELRAWCLAYVGYLLLVLDPFTSLFRYLVLLFPLGALAGLRPGRRVPLTGWVVCCLALQVVWTAWLWRFSPPADWPP
ncbi:hypothetical protein AB2L27_07805 [Kineococcus sp. LSe6-4]|uniref:Integral membrane protein n=1 Tax=Kineococcus halophytocola TaxID=3234027 RepID=A0ABV4GZC8_9ACTN